ncbi:exported hypothetical protein [Mesorhizobium plurifarium]|uniref:Nitrile hydratase beta subunit-like N-terminal domain-containing protein n=1 Tax=Mesorhizobium plurifarium TaxID=69974 RepID=A0A090EMF3_MESPL|nr:exported hypothetical protein [Mesorhizobium plurifarium]
MIVYDPTNSLAAAALHALPARSAEDPIFRLAWHARVFSLIVSLVKEGRIHWPAFQERLVRYIGDRELSAGSQTAEEIDLHYFDCWLEAAHETLVAEGFITDLDVTAQVERIHAAVETIRIEQLTHEDSHKPVAVDHRD